MSANRKGLSVTERHVLRSVAIAVLFVLSGVLGHIPASVPYVKPLWNGQGTALSCRLCTRTSTDQSLMTNAE